MPKVLKVKKLVLVLGTSMPVTAAREKAPGNVENGENGRNNKNEDLRINFIQILYI